MSIIKSFSKERLAGLREKVRTRARLSFEDSNDLLALLDEAEKPRMPSIAGELIDREYAEDDALDEAEKQGPGEETTAPLGETPTTPPGRPRTLPADASPGPSHTMTTKEAIEIVTGAVIAAHSKDRQEALAVLSALAEECAQLKADLLLAYAAATEKNKELAAMEAEVERLKGLIGSGNNELANLFLHQAGVMAELATDRCRLIAEGNCLKARAEKAEAELERARPLIEAVEKSPLRKYADDTVGWKQERPIIEAALAYREGEGMTKLKPCPKCGSEDFSIHYEVGFDRLECQCRNCSHYYSQEPVDLVHVRYPLGEK